MFQPEQSPATVTVDIYVSISLDGGGVIYTESSSSQTTLDGFGEAARNNAANNAAGMAEIFATNAAGAIGGSLGYLGGVAAGNAVMGAVPVAASTTTYAAAIGVAAVAPWVGLAVGAGGGAL